MMPPVTSWPSTVSRMPSSGPTLVKPRKIQDGTEIETVILLQVDVLLGALRDTDADERIVLLAIRAGRPAVDECRVAGNPIRPQNCSASQFLCRDRVVDHCPCPFRLPVGRARISRCWR